MTLTEILEEISKLSNAERLTIIEAASHLIREEIQQANQPLSRDERRRQMALAAEVLRPDYENDAELTIFTALDSPEHWRLCST
jgi:hypothetical protein